MYNCLRPKESIVRLVLRQIANILNASTMFVLYSQIAHKHNVEHLARNINLDTFVRSKLDSYLNHRLIPVPTPECFN